MNGRPPRFTLLLTVCAALLGACRAPSGAGAAGQDSLDTPPSKTAKTAVSTVAATTGDLSVVRTVSATVTAGRDSNVAAQTGGQVAKLAYAEGDAVPSGATVVQLVDSDLRNSVESARIALQNARITLRQSQNATGESRAQLQSAVRAAQSNLDKARAQDAANQKLLALGGVSRTDLQASAAQLAQARADFASAQNNLALSGKTGSGSLALLENQVESAQNNLRQAQGNLAKAAVKAPFAGVVAALPVSQGEFVNAGTTVFRLVDPESLKADFKVSPEAAQQLRPGSAVTLSYGGASYPARLTTNDNRVAGSDRQVNLSARLAGAKLPVGAVAQLSYRANLAGGVLLPVGALQTDGDRTFAYTVEDGKVARTAVEVLAESRGTVAVRGLTGGARVVSPVPPTLRDGEAVAATGATEETGATGGAGQ